MGATEVGDVFGEELGFDAVLADDVDLFCGGEFKDAGDVDGGRVGGAEYFVLGGLGVSREHGGGMGGEYKVCGGDVPLRRGCRVMLVSLYIGPCTVSSASFLPSIIPFFLGEYVLLPVSTYLDFVELFVTNTICLPSPPGHRTHHPHISGLPLPPRHRNPTPGVRPTKLTSSPQHIQRLNNLWKQFLPLP